MNNMSSSYENKDLITACYILSKVENSLNECVRGQLSIDSLRTIQSYLSKTLKYIDHSNESFNRELFIFSQFIESIRDFLDADNGVVDVKMDIKDYITNNLCPAIVSFRVNVGRYLSDHKFEYDSSMNKVLESIVETCISEGYYFDY